MLRLLATIALLAAAPARADVAEAVNDHILPGMARFAEATATLADAADGSCNAEDLRPAYHAAYDAWMAVSHLRLGPAETEGRVLAIAFWPDPKGLGAKAQAALLRAADPAVLTPDRFAEQSVAVRGLTGLERLLYPEAPLQGDYPCALMRATARDLARMASEIDGEWRGGYAGLLLDAGAAGNTAYLNRTEARQAVFTQLIAGLEFTQDQRLGRPLGTFDKPRPERAEALASGRPLRNVTLSIEALAGLAHALVPDARHTAAAFDHALALARALDDPALAAVADPQGWLKVEILQQAVHAARDTALAEMGPALDVGLGFNAADGD